MDIFNSPVFISLALGLAASANVLLGGFLVVGLKRHFNTILGLSGGVMIGVVAFEVLPEVAELLHELEGSISSNVVMSMFVLGIILFHFLSKILPLHEHGHHDDHEHHSHSKQISSVGIYGAIIMTIHSFIDGFGIGVAFSVSSAVGLAVALAVISHNISDGVNTTSTLLKNKVSSLNTKIILTANVLAPLLGVISSFFFNLSSKFVLMYLAFFAGSILYLAISDILPHAHSDLKNKTPLLATLLGIIFIFVISLVVPHS